MAAARMLKLPEVLTEINMSRAAFYRLRARGQAPA
jgi:predicted DNA-binding transcriptional regulator AlpA